MALNPCEVCTCIPPNIATDKFKQSVLLVLCDILSGTVEPVTPNAIPTGFVAIDNQDITNAFTNTGLVDPPWKSVYINNETDGILQFVFANSGADPQVRILANETRHLVFNPAAVSGPLYVMYEVAPTLGTLYIEAWS